MKRSKNSYGAGSGALTPDFTKAEQPQEQRSLVETLYWMYEREHARAERYLKQRDAAKAKLVGYIAQGLAIKLARRLVRAGKEQTK